MYSECTSSLSKQEPLHIDRNDFKLNLDFFLKQLYKVIYETLHELIVYNINFEIRVGFEFVI